MKVREPLPDESRTTWPPWCSSPCHSAMASRPDRDLAGDGRGHQRDLVEPPGGQADGHQGPGDSHGSADDRVGDTGGRPDGDGHGPAAGPDDDVDHVVPRQVRQLGCRARGESRGRDDGIAAGGVHPAGSGQRPGHGGGAVHGQVAVVVARGVDGEVSELVLLDGPALESEWGAAGHQWPPGTLYSLMMETASPALPESAIAQMSSWVLISR